MKHLPRLLLSLAAAFLLSCQAAPVQTAGSPDKTQISYAFGLSVGASLAKTHVDFDWEAFRKGLEETSSGKKAGLSTEEIKKILETAITDARTRRSGENAVAEKTFFESNLRKPGVTAADNGLQYEVVKAASGPHPHPADTVVLKYRGSLADGTAFEDKTAEPGVTAPVARLLPGISQGVQLMSPGAQYKFYLPSALGYGEKGRADQIEPNVPVVYDVELVSINPAKP